MKEFSTVKEFHYGEIESKIGYVFRNKELLKQAFTRRSYANEHVNCMDNEVLEFIGDSIVGLIVVKCLTKRYEIDHPNDEREKFIQIMIESGLDVDADELRRISICQYFESELDEAELSDLKIELVQRASLSNSIERLELEKYLIMGKSDLAGNIQEQASVKEDLFESIVGAVAIDSDWNMNELGRVVNNLMLIGRVIEEGRSGEEDYELSLSNWFEHHGEKLTFAEAPCICKNLTYGVKVSLGVHLLNHEEYGYGLTESGARRMAAKRAINFIRKIGERADAIKRAIGDPDTERAINQLQELYQKKIIPAPPKYTFSQLGTSSSGNPQWECICSIEGLLDNNGGYVCSSKGEAKKEAAFGVLNWLLGIDLASLFIMHGETIEADKESER